MGALRELPACGAEGLRLAQRARGRHRSAWTSQPIPHCWPPSSASVCARPCAFPLSRRSSRLRGRLRRAACCPAPARSSPRRRCGVRCWAGACWSCWPNRSTRRTRSRVALDLFDRLRLREPFAQAFAALGFEGEEGWRVAARIKVVLLSGAGVGQEKQASRPAEPSPAVAEAPRRTCTNPRPQKPNCRFRPRTRVPSRVRLGHSPAVCER